MASADQFELTTFDHQFYKQYSGITGIRSRFLKSINIRRLTIVNRLRNCLIFSATLLLCACTDNSASAKNAVTKEKLSQKLIHDWQGILAEKSSFRSIRVSLNNEANKLTGTMMIGSGIDHGYLRLPQDTAIPVEGTFDPILGYARLLTQSGARTGEYVFEIAQTPVGAIGKFAEAGKYGNKGSRRGEAVFVIPSKAKQLEHLEQTLAALNDRSKTTTDMKICPKRVVTWMQEVNALPKNSQNPGNGLDLFALDTFKKAFGGSYDTLSAQQLKTAQALLQGPCADISNARQLAYGVVDAKTYKDWHYRGLELPIIEVWWSNIKTIVSSDLHIPSSQLDSIQPYFQTFQLGQYYHNYRTELAPMVLARKKANRQQELRLSRLALMEGYSDRLDLMLLAARAQLQQYPDTKDLVTAKLDQLAVTAGQRYAENAKRISEFQYMVSFTQMTNNGVECLLSSEADCKKIAKLFAKRSDDLADDLVNELVQQSKRQLPDTEDLPSLIKHVQFAEQTQRRYGNALTVGDLADAWEDITDERQSLQKDLYDELYTLVANSNNARAVVQTEKQYFFQDDIKQKKMKKLNALLSEKLVTLAPFRDIQGGEYLNALVNRDTKTLRELDQQYTQGFTPFVALAGNAMAMISPSARQDFASFSRNMTAVNPLFASYILNYQKIYPDCLGVDPFVATVSTTTTETRKDGFGFKSHVMPGQNTISTPCRAAWHPILRHCGAPISVVMLLPVMRYSMIKK